MSTPARGAPRPGRIELTALAAVWLREWTVFKYFWRTRTFSAVAEPVVMLLAFGFGFGKLVSHVAGIPYIQFVGTGVVATSVLFSATFSGMFEALYKRRYQRVYDAMLAAPVDVDEIVTGEVTYLGTRAGIYGIAPLLVAFCFGLRPEPAMLLVPADRDPDRDRVRRAGNALRLVRDDLRRPELRDQRRDHADVPRRRHVLPADAPTGLAAATWRRSTRCYHCVQLVRHCAFGLHPLADLGHVGALLLFAVLAWRLAVWRTRLRLID
jgi:lipooligosaccharide transport system permease protein